MFNSIYIGIIIMYGAVHKWRHHRRGRGGIGQKMTNDDMMTKGGGKIWQRYLTLALSHLYPHCKTVNMFGFTKRKNGDIHGGWTGGSRLWRAFNCGQKSNIRCFVAKSIMSRVTLAMGGGSQKVTNDDEGSRPWRAFNCGQKSNIRCFVAKSVMSRVTRAMRGGG